MSAIVALTFLLCLAITVSCLHNDDHHTGRIEVNAPRENVAVDGALVGREILGDTQDDKPIRLVQSSDGRTLVYSVFDASGRLTECRISVDPVEVGAFVNAIHERLTMGNSSAVATKSNADRLLAVDEQRSACEASKSSGANEDERRSRRTKRFFIASGTYWCGMGSVAESSKQLGEDEAADRCCMEHDGCPYFIPKLSSRYGYYNWRPHTLSYCFCDQR